MNKYIQSVLAVIGVFFLINGVSIILQVGGPFWFKVLDIGMGYIPMVLLGYYLAGGKK